MAQPAAGSATWGRLRNPTHLVTLRLAGIVPADRLRELRIWRDEQLAYYADVPRQMREYPPVLED